MRRGQSSVEFLLIVGFSLLMLIPATFLFLNYSADSQDAVIGSQIYQAGRELALTAELINGVGVGSWQTLEIVIPEEVVSISVYGETLPTPSELVINYGDPLSSVVLFIDIPLVNETSTVCTSGCEIYVHSGLNKIRVESTGSSNPRIKFTVIG